MALTCHTLWRHYDCAMNKAASSLTGEEMRAAREAMHLRTTEVAAAMGVSERTVMRWERGDPIPEPIARLFKILYRVESA